MRNDIEGKQPWFYIEQWETCINLNHLVLIGKPKQALKCTWKVDLQLSCNNMESGSVVFFDSEEEAQAFYNTIVSL